MTIKVLLPGMSILRKFFGNYEDESDDDILAVTGEGAADAEEGQLALDVYQTKDNVVVKSTIAGVKPEDLDITITGDSVTIRGERRQEEEIKEEDYYAQECYWGGFYRSFRLPVEIDVDKAVADIKDGILTLTLPKASRSKTKKVKVKSMID